MKYSIHGTVKINFHMSLRVQADTAAEAKDVAQEVIEMAIKHPTRRVTTANGKKHTLETRFGPYDVELELAIDELESGAAKKEEE